MTSLPCSSRTAVMRRVGLGPVHRCLVVSGQVAALVVHGQEKGRPGHLNIADLLHLANPAGGNPAPGAKSDRTRNQPVRGRSQPWVFPLVRDARTARAARHPVFTFNICTAKPAVSERGTC